MDIENALSVFNEIHLDKYLPLIKDIFYHEVPLWKKIPKLPDTAIWNKTIKFSYKTGDNWQGVGPALETSVWPTPNDIAFQQGSALIKYFLARCDIGHFSMKIIKTPQALVDAVSAVLESTTQCATRSMHRMFMSDASGIVTTVTSVDGNTLSVANALDFQQSMRIEAYKVTGSTPAYQHRTQNASTIFTVSSVDYENDTITLADAGDIHATDALAMVNCTDLTAGVFTSKEWTGLRNIFSATGTFQGISRDTYGWFAPYLSTALANRAITPELLFLTLSNMSKSKRQLPDEVICSRGVFASFVKMLMDNSTPSEAVVSDLGFASALSYVYAGKKIKFSWDFHVPDNTMWLIGKKSVQMGEAWDLQWITEGGGKLRLSDVGPQYWAVLSAAGNLVSPTPYECGIIDHITETTS